MNIVYIVAKEARQIRILGAVFFAVCLVMAVTARLIPSRLFVAFAVLLYGIFIIGSAMMTERYEDRNSGYRHLLRLPILPSEIAAAKLALIFLLNIVSCALLIVVVELHGGGVELMRNARSILYLAGCLWLVLIPLIYWGICSFGYTRFTLIMRVTVMALLVIVQLGLLLLFKAGPDGATTMARLSETIAGAPWLVISVAMSLVYFGLVPLTGVFVRRHAARSV